MMTINRLLFIASVLFLQHCAPKIHDDGLTVAEAMDGVVARLYQNLSAEQLDTIGHQYVLHFLSDKERSALANRYWNFRVNVPVRVSVMRDTAQSTVPFWLRPKGFARTNLFVKNEHYTYEVWQKEFPAGAIQLGINGFDKHRPVYFISVENLSKKDSLVISDVYPENQHFEKMAEGAFTYHDWDELVLTSVPEQLAGEVLFTTIRGRAREAHTVHGFRKTPYPSSPAPDQMLLTWSSDPHTSMDIQWRTSTDVRLGAAEYWPLPGTGDTTRVQAVPIVVEDRLLRNDPKVHRFTAELRNLVPGMRYGYRVGNPEGKWSEPATLETPANGDAFSFTWFGDTHRSNRWGDLLQKAYAKYPETAFYSIAGDVVSTGLYRDDWDQLFAYSGNVFAYKPLMPVPGNHDNQDGLGAGMYQQMLSLPKNGPDQVGSELTYAFTYKNALFLMIDCTAPVAVQSEWIEKQLQNTDALWKFAFFHFPPYSWEEDYPEIRKEWGPLFDTYHVDMVMSGHVHYYMRSKPIRNQHVVAGPEDGTVYVISVGIPSRDQEMPPESYAAVRDAKGWLYQHIEINGDRLEYVSINHEGETIDEFSITKP